MPARAATARGVRTSARKSEIPVLESEASKRRKMRRRSDYQETNHDEYERVRGMCKTKKSDRRKQQCALKADARRCECSTGGVAVRR